MVLPIYYYFLAKSHGTLSSRNNNNKKGVQIRAYGNILNVTKKIEKRNLCRLTHWESIALLEIGHRHHEIVTAEVIAQHKIVRLEGEHREITLRVAVLVDLDRRAGHTLIRPILDDRFHDPGAVLRHIPDHVLGQRPRFLAQQLVERPGVQFHRIVQIGGRCGNELEQKQRTISII